MYMYVSLSMYVCACVCVCMYVCMCYRLISERVAPTWLRLLSTGSLSLLHHLKRFSANTSHKSVFLPKLQWAIGTWRALTYHAVIKREGPAKDYVYVMCV